MLIKEKNVKYLLTKRRQLAIEIGAASATASTYTGTRIENTYCKISKKKNIISVFFCQKYKEYCKKGLFGKWLKMKAKMFS